MSFGWCPQRRPTDKRVTLSLQNVPASEVLRYIGDASNLKFSYDAYAVKIRASSVGKSRVTGARLSRLNTEPARELVRPAERRGSHFGVAGFQPQLKTLEVCRGFARRERWPPSASGPSCKEIHLPGRSASAVRHDAREKPSELSAWCRSGVLPRCAENARKSCSPTRCARPAAKCPVAAVWGTCQTRPNSCGGRTGPLRMRYR